MNHPEEKSAALPAKPWWASRGIVGPMVAIVAVVASLRGVQIDADSLTDTILQVVDLVLAAIAIGGAACGIIGRWRAKAPITFRDRRSFPGKPMNPDAPVRKAHPVDSPSQRFGPGRTNRGFVVPQLVLCLAALALVAFMQTRFAYSQSWAQEARAPRIHFSETLTAEYQRPFLDRLLGSLAIGFESSPAGTRLRVNPRYLNLRGGNETLDALARHNLSHSAYAVMLKGGADF